MLLPRECTFGSSIRKKNGREGRWSVGVVAVHSETKYRHEMIVHSEWRTRGVLQRVVINQSPESCHVDNAASWLNLELNKLTLQIAFFLLVCAQGWCSVILFCSSSYSIHNCRRTALFREGARVPPKASKVGVGMSDCLCCAMMRFLHVLSQTNQKEKEKARQSVVCYSVET